jgi:CRISPR-associated exonuclease Cas4
MALFLAALFLLALSIALGLWHAARKTIAQAGLSVHARVIASDTGAWKSLERPLFSSRYQLTGKPDYIVQVNGATIPVEVKPNRVAREPYESDVLQLAAYGLLIQEALGAAPAFGLLKYRDEVFQIALTDELRAQLLAVMDQMRRDFAVRDVAASHSQSQRCRACGYRDQCGQAIKDHR